MKKNLLKIGFISACLAVVVMFSSQLKASSFIEGLEDVPIMSGLKQVPNDNISFGNEESRLVEVYLTGKKATFKSIEKFYKDTLPQLGWTYQGKRKNTLIFYREEEAINIALEQENPILIRITVKSKI